VDFVRKSVRAIGRCAIKVEVGLFLLKRVVPKLESVSFILFALLYLSVIPQVGTKIIVDSD